MKFSKHETESLVFYLHYWVTFLLLMACCIMVTFNIYVRSPIVCTDPQDVSARVMTSYCWSHSTYSVASSYSKKAGVEIPYPGVGASSREDDIIYRDYYQYIYLVLFLQGVFFYVPHGLWKSLENGKMKQLWKSIENPPPVSEKLAVSEESGDTSRDDKIYASAVFLRRRLGWFNRYALGYWFCEILSWLNVIFQVYFLNSFFQGEFISFGGKAMAYFKTADPLDNPLLLVFPRVAKCLFHKFGRSGDVFTETVLCVLPVNALTEKIYLFVWFWFFLLFGLSSLGILMTAVTFLVPRVRGLRLSLAITPFRRNVAGNIEGTASAVGRQCGFGDWFVLSVLAERMDILDFKLFLKYLREEVTIPYERSERSDKFSESATSV